MKQVLKRIIIILILVILPINFSFAKNCTGRFINPITDICWECMFPITIGQMEVVGSDLADTENPASPICMCSDPIPRIGINAGFWEPVRLVDVTKRPFCFPNLNGTQIDLGLDIGMNHAPDSNDFSVASWHVHWYIYPIMAWLNILTDFACLESNAFDLAYISEFDPLWQDDALTFLLNPEAILFANPIAQAACAADCISATTDKPIDSLFWCAGCQGSIYPVNGKIQSHIGSIQSSLLAAIRMNFKLHRQFLAWGTKGPEAICGRYPMPIMQKTQYRSQLTVPIASDCKAYGASTTSYEAGKEIPITGEDFGYLIWRKRNCCVF